MTQTETPQAVTTYQAKQRAQQDWRHGGGQDDNPYSKARQFEAWEAYAIEMHRLWAEEFRADMAGRP